MRLPGRYDGVARPIVVYGSNPVLHRAGAPVTELGEGLRRLVLDMFASMSAADGVGLAANQIGVDARIFVIDCPDADGEDVVGYVINPTLTLPGPVLGVLVVQVRLRVRWRRPGRQAVEREHLRRPPPVTGPPVVAVTPGDPVGRWGGVGR